MSDLYKLFTKPEPKGITMSVNIIVVDTLPGITRAGEKGGLRTLNETNQAILDALVIRATDHEGKGYIPHPNGKITSGPQTAETLTKHLRATVDGFKVVSMNRGPQTYFTLTPVPAEGEEEQATPAARKSRKSDA
jgi:hypothetical protein